MFLNDESIFSNITNTINFINNSDNKIKKVTFITTSNRYKGDKLSIPKSTMVAKLIKKYTSANVNIIDMNDLKIHVCEGNVSSHSGNNCGVIAAMMKDDKKNPHNILRCWASVNNEDDELYKIVNSIIDSQLVIFFTSVRWGQTNSQYQKLIERLTWLENRHSTLGEDNPLKKIKAGIVIMGHNFNGSEILNTQRQVLKFFGFDFQNTLSWNYQYTNQTSDETQQSYKGASKDFIDDIKKYIMKRDGKLDY